MRREVGYRVFVVIAFIVLLVTGVMLGMKISGNQASKGPDITEVANPSNEHEVSVYEEVPTVSNKKFDIELIYHDNYRLCGETITSKKVIYDTTLANLKEMELQKQTKENITYDVIEENNDRLVFSRTLNQNCPNHFLVKLEEGVIIIYNVVEEGVTTVYQKIDIPHELIKPELLEELNQGIMMNSKEDLNLLIEDIES